MGQAFSQAFSLRGAHRHKRESPISPHTSQRIPDVLPKSCWHTERLFLPGVWHFKYQHFSAETLPLRRYVVEDTIFVLEDTMRYEKVCRGGRRTSTGGSNNGSMAGTNSGR